MTKTQLHIGHVNINHIPNKVHDIHLLLTQQPYFHVFGVTETKLSTHKHDENTACIPNYFFCRRDAEHPNHTGIGAYIHHSVLQYTKRRTDLETQAIECIWLEVRPYRSSPLLIGFVYRHPKSKQDWAEDYLSMMDKVNLCRINTLILGDFNINLLDQIPVQWQNTNEMLGLSQLITAPTRVAKSSSTLLDHIYTNNVDMVQNPKVLDVSISDHNPVSCFWSSKHPRKEPKGHTYIQYRCFKKFNKAAFTNELSMTDFNHIMNYSDPEKAADMFSRTLLSVIDNHAPLRKKRVKYSTIPNWMTSEIKEAMTLRNEFKKNKKFEEYKKQRNKVTDLVRNAKKTYFQKMISVNKDISHIWQAMNEISNKSSKKKRSVHPIFSPDEFNNHFLSIVDSILSSSKTDALNYHIPTKLVDFCSARLTKNDSFVIPKMTEYEVESLISKLSNKRSMDIDNLNSSILKMSLPFIVKSLTYLYNLCIDSCIFPAVFKRAKVIPLPKSKDISDIDNYRPISILPILSKPLEKHINLHLLKYFDSNDLFHKYQSGFRPKHSCHTALTRMCDSWLKAINNRNIIGAVFLDLRKAFDLINHNILLQKLDTYLQRNKMVSFFASYLSNRNQSVYANGAFSSSGIVNYGVPQGSILGPLLFCIYINDLPLHISSEAAVLDLFADDSSLHSEGDSLNDIQVVLQDSINDVNTWCKNNQMVLHPKKSKCMVITTRQKHQIKPLNVYLKLNQIDIEQVHKHRVLGVIIDDELSWHSHIDYITKLFSRNLFLLNKLWHYVDNHALKAFFYAHCISHINYASTVWCKASTAHINKLNSLHRRGVKLLIRDPIKSTEEKYQELNILPLDNQFKYNCSMFMFKLRNSIITPYLKEFFEKGPDNLRSQNYVLPKPRIDLYKTSLAFWGSLQWNSLPNECKMCGSLSSFKQNVRRYLQIHA